MRIQDNVFLITGGASGLGAAAAQALVEAGRWPARDPRSLVAAVV